MLALLALHAAVAATLPWLARRLGHRVFLVGALAPAAAVAWAIANGGRVLDGEVLQETYRWVPGLGMEIGLRLDAFSLLMVGVVSGVGLLVCWYAVEYFGRPERGLGAFAATLVAFAGAMLGLVLADDVYFLFLCWELTSITSYLLIGYHDEQEEARAAAQRALLVTAAGGLAMLAGLVLLSQAAGTSSLQGIVAAAPRGGTVDVALVLVAIGAFAKSAQVPFHYWLPGAMAAPTPVSAYLHSATMVKAGVYLLARLAPAFADVAVWRPLVLGVGLATMLFGGWLALSRHDLKALLAYGTISQLGFMVVLFGAGEPTLTKAGVAVLLAHALFKATLFMVAGIVDHQAHTRDVRRLSGLGRRLPVAFAIAGVAAASMAAIPPALGFLSKEKAYDALLEAHFDGSGIVLAGIVAGSALTLAYSVRFLLGAFGSKPDDGTVRVGPEVERPTRAFVAPTIVLSVGTLLFGIVPDLVNPLVKDAALAIDGGVEGPGLALWPGLTVALALSTLTWVAGAAIATLGGPIERLRAPVPGGDGIHGAAVRGVLRFAGRVTALVQSGSLRIYLATVLLVVLALPGLSLLRHAPWPDDLQLASSPEQAVVVGLVSLAAFATVLASRRFVAVITVGAVGYGVALLFALWGAPDLALVQVLVETLIVVVFVLVLRHLPDHFPRAVGARWPRALLAAAIGTFAAAFTLVAAGARVAPSVSDTYVRDALPEAGGRNIVNVILVDFRAFDTLGETTVVVVAGLGIISLLVARLPGRHAEPEPRPERTS